MSDDNVIDFPGVNYGDVPPEAVLKAAIKADLTDVLVIGWTKDNKLYVAPSMSSPAEALMLSESFRHALMES